MVAENPYRIRPCDLAAADPAKLSKLNEALRRRSGRAEQGRPATRSMQYAVRENSRLVLAMEVIDRIHLPERSNTMRAADTKTGNHRRRHGVWKRFCSWVKETKLEPPERSSEEPANEIPVVHVEPLRGSHIHPQVAWPSQGGGLHKEVYMGSSELTRMESEASSGLGEPGFPVRLDVVMPNVRRIAKKQRRTGDTGQRDCAEVLDGHLSAMGEARDGEVGTTQKRGQRIELHC